MKLEISTRQKKEKVERRTLSKRTECPKCRSKNLLSDGPDQFCCDCDWDTCLEYVEKGLMNNLEISAWEHFADLPIKPSHETPKQDEGNEATSLTASA